MDASVQNPIYTVYVIIGSRKYNITTACTSINLSHQEKEVAQSATITVVNIKMPKEKATLCDLLKVRQRVFIYANDGKRKEEVFRGWTWTKQHQSTLDETAVTLKCFDNLIYLKQSEDAFYFGKGKNTKAVMKSICEKWGIKLNYTYSTITHKKLVLRGNLTDMIVSDILDLVKDKTGNEYVIRSQKDVMNIEPVGKNKLIYKIEKRKNTTDVRYEYTMDDMVTKVQIVTNSEEKSSEKSKDKEKSSGKSKVVVKATVKGNTKKYGTLQKLQDKDKDTSLKEAKKEAQNTIDKYGEPAENVEVDAADIPWIRKGDKIYLFAGHVRGRYFIVAGIERDISNQKKTMTLTLKKPIGNAK